MSDNKIGPSTFLSYSWDDDKPFVERLYHDMQSQGLTVWWDDQDMRSRGNTLRQEIRDAITQADFLVPVIGPVAIQKGNTPGSTINLEWECARQLCKAITPVVRLGNPKEMPGDFYSNLWFDFRESNDYRTRLRALITQLKEFPSQPSQLLNVPALPPHYLPRQNDLVALADSLLIDGQKPPFEPIVALQGMGGIGKSVIAAAFCHDCATRRSFSNGIVWVQVGRIPNMIGILGEACRKLGSLQNYKTIGDAIASLQVLLSEKAYLLVLDDIWDAKHAQPFRDAIAGTASGLLVTTRNPQVVGLLGAQEHKVRLLTRDEAVTLLEQWTSKTDPEYVTIANKLGHLPLAIKLAGALMFEGYSAQEWLQTFDRVSRITINDASSNRDESLEASINLSIEAAFPGSKVERKPLYHIFGILPEGTRIPQTVVLKMWSQIRPDLDHFTLMREADRLARFALIDRDENKVITLHQMLHGYCAEHLGAVIEDSSTTDPWAEVLSIFMKSDEIDFYSRTSILDSIRDSPELSKTKLDLLLNYLQVPSYEIYFFDGLNDVRWVKFLQGHGAFNKPPNLEQDEKGAISAPIWSRSMFLARVADQAPDDVLEVILGMDTDNWAVQRDILNAARNMPGNYAARIVPIVNSWFDRNITDWLLSDVARLLSQLIENAQFGSALALFEATAKPYVPIQGDKKQFLKPTPRYNPNWFRNVVDAARRLIEQRPLDVLQIVRKQLEEANQQIGGDDSWRSAIENHEQNSVMIYEYLQTLLITTRDLMARIAQENPKEIEKMVAADLEHPLPIFRRLAIHLIRTNPNSFFRSQSQLLSDRRFLDDSDVFHEYALFLREGFPQITMSDQKNLIQWIQDGPSYSDDREYKVYWIRRWLRVLENHVPAETLSIYGELHDQDEWPDQEVFLSLGSGVVFWPGSANPISEAELAELSDDALFDFLSTFKGQGGIGPSVEGLVNQLQQLIVEQADRFAKLAPRFIDLNLRYIGCLLSGLEQAWKMGKSFEWEPIIDLTNRLLEVQLSYSSGGLSHGELLGRVATLFMAGVHNDDHALPANLLPQVRDLLLRILTRTEDSSTLNWITSGNADPIVAALNSTHGQATQALLSYALHRVRTQLPEAAVQARFSSGEGLEPIVKNRLTISLDEKQEPNPAVRTWYGGYLPQLLYLDQEWVRENLDRIFPASPEYQFFWQAAWEGYLFFVNSIDEKLYDLLYPQYQRAIAQLCTRIDQSGIWQLSGEVALRLAQHIAIFYLRGLENLDQDQTSILQQFLDCATDEQRAAVVRFYANKIDAQDSDIWLKLRAYWEDRAGVFKSANDLEQYTEERGAFAAWLDKVPERIDTLHELVASISQQVGDVWAGSYDILKYLDEDKVAHPALCGRILNILVDSVGARLRFTSHEDYVGSILKAMIQSNDEEASQIARQIVNRFGELGVFSYKSLLY